MSSLIYRIHLCNRIARVSLKFFRLLVDLSDESHGITSFLALDFHAPDEVGAFDGHEPLAALPLGGR